MMLSPSNCLMSVIANNLLSHYDISLLQMSSVMSELVVVLECSIGVFHNISLTNPLNEGLTSKNVSGYLYSSKLYISDSNLYSSYK